MEKITINGIEYKLTPVEKVSVDKVEPKFKVGDEIKTANEESLTITKIDEKGYWSKDLFICSFDEECIWDLVEQKPTDEVKPKFKVGDWIVDNCGYVWKIEGILNQFYILEGVEGGESRPTIEWVNKAFHLWTIQDAKDGDVLFQDLMGGKTFIYNGVNPDMAILYSFIISNDGEDVLPYHIGKPNTGIGIIEENKNIIHPAAKKQRDLIFKKMYEAGYEWDEENKELKKIEAKEAMHDKPKFKVGDWIVFNGLVLFIKEVVQGYYRTISVGGIPNSYDWDIDNVTRLWTIQDAKDGDVLAIDPWSDYPSSFVAIYKKQNEEDFDSYCFVGFDGKFYKGENGHSTEYIHPATKEQRDLLFQKMKEEGYEWDAEKKELKKNSKQHLISNYFNAEYKRGKADALKSVAWSEEDKEMCQETIDWFEKKCFPYALENDNPARESIKWLKSLKNRVLPQPKHEWSEDDKRILDYAIDMVEWYSGENEDKSRLVSDWLKSLRPQPKQKWSEEDNNCLSTIIAEFSKCAGKSVSRDEWMRCNDFLNSLKNRVLSQSKQEWGEEDEEIFKEIVGDIEVLELKTTSEKYSAMYKKELSWLESLKDRVQPKNNWKPSYEQIKVLESIIENRSIQRRHLVSLYEQLKELKRE